MSLPDSPKPRRPRRAIVDIATKTPPQETVELRRELARFIKLPLSQFVDNPPLTKDGKSITVGAVKWGVYAFFDYDNEPIYVGQTREALAAGSGAT